MQVNIDGDILVYRVGYTTLEESVHIACARMDETINRIADETEASEVAVYLTGTGHNGFRYKLFPEYKANRKQPKPTWYSELRAHLVHDYEAHVTEELEADDALGINQTSSTILCTIDKDLDQIPGKHYDFVKRVLYDVDEAWALRFFYLQLLQGDATDNIRGIPGIGPKNAIKILNGLSNEKDYLDASIRAYQKAKLTLEYMTLIGRLIKIRRRENEPLWDVEREAERLGVAVSKTTSKRASKGIKSSTSTNPLT